MYRAGNVFLSAAAASIGSNVAASGPGEALGAVVAALQGESVTDKQEAKKQLLVDVYTLMENPLQMVGKMGNGSLCSGET